MRTVALAGLLASLFATASCLAFAATPPTPATPPAVAPPAAVDPSIKRLAPVVVSGMQTGPGLWKVSKGGNTLWILGLVSPLPRGMDWYAPQTEARLRESSEIIGPPQFAAMVGFGSALKMAFALPTLLRARKNADGKTLAQVLPPDLYARWARLKLQYLPGNDAVEQWRPQFAASALYDAAIKSAGLENDHKISRRVYALADDLKLRKTSSTISFEVSDPKRLAKSFADTPVDDAACFRSVLDQLDADVREAADRANAWAIGDVPELARLAGRSDESCIDAFLQVQAVREMGMQDALPRARLKWLAAVDAALAANRSTFAMLPVQDLLASGGVLDELRRRGYVVETPE
jgi:hypothetical protein